MSDDSIKAKCRSFAKLFGLLDVIWANVRGVEAGLLPTDEQCNQLEKALAEAKQLWIDMELTTNQPKWHLTFDGHLLHQVKTYGGLADKSEDCIEKYHQTLKSLCDRFRGVKSYKHRETCIRRELRRRRSPQIKAIIDTYEASIKQRSTTKRKHDTLERQSDKKEAKKVKREAFTEP